MTFAGGQDSRGAIRFARPVVKAMKGYEPGEQPRRRDVIKLNTNENPYPPSPRVAEALASLDTQLLSLYPDPLCTELREEVARLHHCSPREVIVGNGSDDILAMCFRAFADPGDRVGYVDPSYSLYPVLCEIAGAEKAPVPLGPDYRWVPPPGYEAKVFLLTNPNAPTGVLFPTEQVESFVRSFGGLVVIDEAYADFARENCADLAVRLPNVLVVRSLSKSYSLAGLRVGYAFGCEELIETLLKVKDSYNVGLPAQVAALAALRDRKHMLRNVEMIRMMRERMRGELEKRGFEVAPSETNFLWVRHPRIQAEELFRRLKEDGILVRHFPGEKTGLYLRITVGTEADLYALTGALDRILAQ